MYSRICGDRMSHNIKCYEANQCMETITIYLLAISYNLMLKIVRSSEMFFSSLKVVTFIHVSVRKLAPGL